MAQSAPRANNDLLSAQMLTVVALMVVFFFASAAASSAYLTEIFLLEIRAIAIAFFYAIGTGVGGASGPLLLGSLIGTASHADFALGYFLGAVLMLIGAVVEATWGVAAERKSLESVARPPSFIEQ